MTQNGNDERKARSNVSTKKVGWTILVLAILFLIFGAACNTTRSTTSPVSDSTSLGTSPVVTARVTPPVVSVPEAPAAPSMTTNQASAVRKAESYIEYQAFSKSGLVKQLKFEKYSDADAKFAVEHITVNWTEQAAKKAESYMSFQSFSRDGLIKQLKFEGFTTAEATHGANSVGLK